MTPPTPENSISEAKFEGFRNQIVQNHLLSFQYRSAVESRNLDLPNSFDRRLDRFLDRFEKVPPNNDKATKSLETLSVLSFKKQNERFSLTVGVEASMTNSLNFFNRFNFSFKYCRVYSVSS